MKPDLTLKSQLYAKCAEYIALRMSIVQAAIDAASESGNDETKSSAGDKHETGRAMMQLEQEKNGKQLHEVQELQRLLNKIDPSHHVNKISLGSLVYTDKCNFYISISAGKLVVDSNVYLAISPVSPIAMKLMGLSAGGKMEFNGVKYIVMTVV